MRKLVLTGVAYSLLSAGAMAQSGDPLFESWVLNTDGTGGNTYTATRLTKDEVAGSGNEMVRIDGTRYRISLEENTDTANVTEISYSDDYIYVRATGVASYNLGPYIYDGNTNVHEKVDHLWKIPRNPQEQTGNKTSATSGNLAVFVNGMPYYPPGDDQYYIDQMGTQVWKRNAGVMEAAGFDCSGGHPAGEYYHYHRIPSPDVVHGIDTMCAYFPSEGLFNLDSTKHSPIIGWGFDGYPIYGPYGYSDANDAGSSIALMVPSWQQRDYVDGKRTTLWDEDTQMEEALAPQYYGPDVDETVDGTTYPLGAFFDDYIFEEGSGDLDRYNGRWCSTPEYPDGIYAYFATVDADWEPTFPYVMGEELYGVAAEENLSIGAGGVLSGSVIINEPVSDYFPVLTGLITGTEADRLLNAYPNPAANFLTINLNAFMGEDVVVDVVNTMGQPLASESIEGLNYILHVVNVANLEQGNYLLRVKGASLTLAQQISVE